MCFSKLGHFSGASRGVRGRHLEEVTILGLFTDQEGFKISRVGSGRVGSGRVGSGQEVLKYHGSNRVQEVLKSCRSGGVESRGDQFSRVGLGRVGS